MDFIQRASAIADTGRGICWSSDGIVVYDATALNLVLADVHSTNLVDFLRDCERFGCAQRIITGSGGAGFTITHPLLLRPPAALAPASTTQSAAPPASLALASTTRPAALPTATASMLHSADVSGAFLPVSPVDIGISALHALAAVGGRSDDSVPQPSSALR